MSATQNVTSAERNGGSRVAIAAPETGQTGQRDGPVHASVPRTFHETMPVDGPELSGGLRHDILGVGFSLVSYEDVIAAVRRWQASGEKHYVTLTPPHSVLMSQRDRDLKEATALASMTLPDGIGIILAAHLLRYPHYGRVSGPVLMLKLCDWGRDYGLRHFFYGGLPDVADILASRLSSQFQGLRVVGTYSPPFGEMTPAEDADVVCRINRCRPDLVWVGLGSPKQEKWMASHLWRIDAAAMIGVGAAFDFHSGRVRWAPPWMRRIGLEWAHRLACDPKRMWRRNINSVIFLTKVCCQHVAGLSRSWSSRESLDVVAGYGLPPDQQLQQPHAPDASGRFPIEESATTGGIRAHADSVGHA